MRIVLAGGGTGGHVFPLLAVAQELRRQDPEVELRYIGCYGQFSDNAEEIMGQEGIATKRIFAGKMRRYVSLHYVADVFFRVPFGLLQSFWFLLTYMPDAVFSKGGYASVPVVFAAWIYRIPVLTHESDATPGWANRINGKFSRYVAVSYPGAKAYFVSSKVILTGNPIRPELAEGNATRALTQWGFSDQRPLIFVFGGSQGARAINNAIINILPQLLQRAQVLHVSGEHNHKDVLRAAGEQGVKSGRHRYVAVPFLSRAEMADAYAAAKIVVSRAGANSISEIAANKKPAILIPLANVDQKTNAFEAALGKQSHINYDQMKAYGIAGAGGAIVLEEANLGEHILMDKISLILDDAVLYTSMAEKISAFYHPDAAQRIAEGVYLMIND